MKLKTISAVILFLFSCDSICQGTVDVNCYSDLIQFNQLKIPVIKYAGWRSITTNVCSTTTPNGYQVSGDSATTIYSSRSFYYGVPSSTNVKTGNLESSFVSNNGGIQNIHNQNSLRMGPYSDFALSNESLWQKYWVLTKANIDFHLANYNNVGYVLNPDIASWPTHGDTTLGESFYLAPFEDYNNNGIYDPLNGDYPLIKGSKCVYMIMNDIRNGTSPGQIDEQLNLEIHRMIYSFECEQDSALNYTLFVDNRIINKGAGVIDSMIFAELLDFDIGNASDDFVGTDVMRGLVYFYNGDSFDENSNGTYGYGISFPAQGFGILKGMKKSDNLTDDGVGYLNAGSYNGFGFGDGIVDNEFNGLTNSIVWETSSWSSGVDSMEVMYDGFNGFWMDGSLLLYGNTSIVSKYIFPGISDPSFYGTASIDPGIIWSEESSNNTPADRRMLASSVGGSLSSGEETTVSTYYVYARDFQTGNLTKSIPKLKIFSDSIRSYFFSNETLCGQTFDYYYAHNYLAISNNETEKSILIYPNPSQNIIYIEGIKEAVNVKIYDTKGKLLKQIQNFENGSIDIRLFNKGLYFIQFDMKGSKIMKKIIKE